MEFPRRDRYGHQLPFVGDGDFRLIVEPGLGHISLPVVPDRLESVVGVAAMPTVYAGSLLTSSTARCAQQLASRSTAILRELTVDKLTPVEAGIRLGKLDSARTQLHSSLNPFLRTAVHLFVDWLFGDPEYYRWYTERYAANNPQVSEAQVQEAIESMRSDWGGYHDEFAALVHDIRESYGFDVAQTLIDHTLSPPITSLSEVKATVDGLSQQLSRDLLLQHARNGHTRLEEIKSPQQLSPAERRQKIQQTPGDSFADSSIVTPSFEAISMDSTVNTRSSDTTPAGSDEVLGTPTGLSWFLHRAFAAGGFRAVVYGVDGELQWLTAPESSIGSSNIEYSDQGWTQSFVTNRLLDQLVGSTGAPNEDLVIRCPLCSCSVSVCGDGVCAFTESVSTMRDEAGAICDGLQNHGR